MDDVVAVIGLLGGYALLMDDDENLDEGDDVAVPRQRLEPVIRVNADDFRHLEDGTFKEQFRMSRALFEELLLFVGNHLQTAGRLQRVRTPLDLCLMMALWILATQDSFRSVAVKFGVPSRGTVHYHFKTIIRALREVAPNFIRWPDEYERDNIKAALERRYGYNGVVGCIDGTAIYISAPLVQPQRYFNGRLHHYTISLQAVCDHNLVFRDIFVGQPGSVHDSMMFKRSPLSHQLLHNNDMLHPDEHLLGDGAYTLTDKVITPFRMNGNFNRRRRRHNYFHARARSCIERAFALLKVKWRRQKLLLSFSLAYLTDLIVASCVLHNFIILEGRAYPPVLNEGILVAQEPQEGAEGGAVADEVDPALHQAQVAGRIKRDYLAYLIYPDDD